MSTRRIPKIRPFLKWAGGKYDLVDRIKQYLPEGKTLIEPFVGAGAVFLNTDYKKYILNDINHDLINLYLALQHDGESFIQDAKAYFIKRRNSEGAYYSLRTRFNNSTDTYERSLIFLYLNKFGYNGLCRYNSLGEFNVPFGRHKSPQFPQEQLEQFCEKSQSAKFVCEDFSKTFKRARGSQIVYCDPPYAPLSETSNFSDYSTQGFTLDDQKRLAETAKEYSRHGITTVISNHDTRFTRRIYKGSKIVSFYAKRSISCKPNNRASAKEIIAIYPAH